MKAKKPYYVLLTSFFPSSTSWRCAFGYDYARALQRQGSYQVVVIRPGIEDYDYGGVRVSGFPVKPLRIPFAPSWLAYRANQRRFLSKLSSLGIGLTEIAVVEAYNADLGFYGWAVKERSPSVVLALHHHSLRSFGILDGWWPVKAVNFLWMRKIHESQDVHLFISPLCERSFRAFPKTDWTTFAPYRGASRGLGPFRPPRIRHSCLIPNGVDRGVFNSSGRKRHPGFVIGCVANFQPLKGHLTLLCALAMIKDKIGDWKLLLVGSGETRLACEAFVADNGLSGRVDFLAEMAHEDLPRFYRSLDLFVLPSVFEGFGCVYTEAFACGTPFIACTRDNGIADWVGEKEKWLVPPGDVGALARCILSYFENRPEQRLCRPIEYEPYLRGYLKTLKALLPMTSRGTLGNMV